MPSEFITISPIDGRELLRRAYTSESARRAALPAWLHFYNHHRPHTAIGKLPPISRISNNLGSGAGTGDT